MDIIKSIEHEQMKNKIPVLKVGDTVKVSLRIKEGNRERIQVFEGIIIKKQHGGLNTTFTVRKISYGVGVEKTFLLHSPIIEKIEVTRIGKTRRAKLFYLRDKIGKAAKTKEKIGSKIETKEIQIKEDEVVEKVETKINETLVKETIVQEPALEKAENIKDQKQEKEQEQIQEAKEEKVEKNSGKNKE